MRAAAAARAAIAAILLDSGALSAAANQCAQLRAGAQLRV